jgi:hypothetical protein
LTGNFTPTGGSRFWSYLVSSAFIADSVTALQCSL